MSGMDDISPDIEALLKETESKYPASTESFSSIADIEIEEDSTDYSMVRRQNNGDSDGEKPQDSGLAVDLSKTGFKPVEKYFEEEPNPVFDDKTYYKTTFTGEDESATRLHNLLSKYLKSQDKKERTDYRSYIEGAYWNFARSLCTKMAYPKTPLCKRFALRYGVVLPSLFSPEQKDFFSRAVINNTTGEPILYVDEWLKEVAAGRLTLSVTDEVPAKKKGPGADQQQIMQLKNKNNGKLQSAENLASMREN